MTIISNPHAAGPGQGAGAVAPSTPAAPGSQAAGTLARVRPEAQAVDRFRSLMAQRQASPPGGGEGAPVLAGRQADAAEAFDRARADALKVQAHERREDGAGDAGVTMMAGHAAAWAGEGPRRDVPLPSAPAEQAAAPRIAELLDRHVRQLAASEGAAGGDGQVLLRMADATLPGTDLLLTRTPDGWALRADVRSRGSYDAIREAAPELARRFAARNLGTLTVDPHLHE